MVIGLEDHPGLGPLDEVDLVGLVLDREVAVEHAEAALAGHRDRHPGLGDGVHAAETRGERIDSSRGGAWWCDVAGRGRCSPAGAARRRRSGPSGRKQRAHQTIRGLIARFYGWHSDVRPRVRGGQVWCRCRGDAVRLARGGAGRASRGGAGSTMPAGWLPERAAPGGRRPGSSRGRGRAGFLSSFPSRRRPWFPCLPWWWWWWVRASCRGWASGPPQPACPRPGGRSCPSARRPSRRCRSQPVPGVPPPGLAGAATNAAGTSTMAPSSRRARTSAGAWVLRDVCASPAVAAARSGRDWGRRRPSA